MSDPIYADLHREIGEMKADIANTKEDMAEVRSDIRTILQQINMGQGTVRFLGWVGGALLALLAGAAWVGQHFKPFG